MELQGCHAGITGGAGGIGAALVRRLVEAGATRIVVADLDGDAAAAIAAGVSSELGGCETLGLAVDVGRAEEIDRLVDAAEDEHGPIDLSAPTPAWPGPTEVPRSATRTGSGPGAST